MSDNITVTKTDTGWTVTKGGQTFTVTDKNKDGNWDSNDTISFNPDGETLSASDLYEAKFRAKTEVTEAEMAKYAEFRKLKDAADAEKAVAQDKERQAKLERYKKATKKKSFWEKATPWVNFANQAAMTIGMTGMMIDAYKGSYGGCTDCSVNSYSKTTGIMLGLSAVTQLATSIPGMQPKTPSTNSSSMLNTEILSTSLYPTLSTANTAESRLNAFLTNEKLEAKAAKDQEAKIQTQYQSGANSLLTQYNESEIVEGVKYKDEVPASNLNKLRSLTYDDSIDKEEQKQLIYLRDYGFVPCDKISEQEESGKLTEKQAKIVQNAILEYLKSGKTCADEYKNVKEHLEGNSLDYDTLKDLLEKLRKAMDEDTQ